MTLIIVGFIALLLAALERIPRIRFRPSALLRRYFASDLVYLVTGFIAGGSASTAYIIAASAWLSHAVRVPRLAAAGLPMWLLVPLALVALDFGNYLAHYCLHRSDLLWELHKAHHSSLSLDWLATFRSHILEQTFRRLVAPVLLILVGFPLDAVLIASAAFTGWAMLNHSNLDLNLRFLEPVLITPRLHRVHHVYKTSERNLGTVFTVWDLLRSTLDRRELPGKIIFSNGDATYPQGWLSQLVEPLPKTRPIGQPN